MKELILIISLLVLSLSGMEQDQNKLIVYSVPQQGGIENDKDSLLYYSKYLKGIVGKRPSSFKVIETPNPLLLSDDLSQNRCINLLKKAFNLSQECIIHGASEGGGTILNFLAHHYKGNNIKAVILEAPLVSGNSAIHQNVKDMVPKITNLPFSYYWLPYCAKAVFPFYWPGGKQPIKSAKKIPTNIPIIIIHSIGDRQISYTDSCALYYALRSNGNKNVYFLSLIDGHHFGNLSSSNDEKKKCKKIVQQILKQHNLLTTVDIPNISEQGISEENQEQIDLSTYQPDEKSRYKLPDKKYKEWVFKAPEVDFKGSYDHLIAKEKKHTWLGYFLGTAAIGLTLRVLYGLSKKIRFKYFNKIS